MSEGPRFAWPQASGTLRRFRRALGTIRCDVDGADSGDPVGIAQGGLDADAIDCFEVNDAWRYRFCWEREIGVDAGRLNPWGGAIALGHQLGAPARADGDDAPRLERTRPLRTADDVRSGRNGERHDRRAPVIDAWGMDMKFAQNVGLVTGGASGLGLATAKRLQRKGMRVVIVDLPTSKGKEVARDLGDNARFVAADVADAAQMSAAFDAAQDLGTLRALVHCAGRGGAVRLVDRDGNPGSLETFEAVIRTNLVGTFNTLRLAAARMARNEPEEATGTSAC